MSAKWVEPAFVATLQVQYKTSPGFSIASQMLIYVYLLYIYILLIYLSCIASSLALPFYIFAPSLTKIKTNADKEKFRLRRNIANLAEILFNQQFLLSA
jgi:hypothetical protein